jgi:hypothetical protein
MAYEAMFATISPFLVIYDNTTKASINLQELTELEPLTLAWMLTIIQTPPRSNFPLFDLMFTFSPFGLISLKPLVSLSHKLALVTFSPFGIKSPKSPKQNGSKKASKS